MNAFGTAARTGSGLGTIANTVVIGLATDWGLSWIERPDDLATRGLLMVGGVVLNGLAGALYIGAQLGPGPRDGLMTGLARRTGWSLRLVRTGIEVIDGSSGSGSQVLFGSASGSESLKGGSGTNSLWGGAGAVSDTLIGGSGTTTYGFGTGEGNDVITSSTSSDTVLLYDVSLSDISSCGVTSGAMVITLTDGSSLKIKNYTSSSVNTFTLSDGTSYTYDYSTKGWSVKS